jgi:hypothetical protein
VPRDWPFGIDIDGRVVFDLDADRTLASFDLHVPRSRWQKTLAAEEVLPAVAPAGDIVFSKEAIAKKSFNMPLSARCDSNRSVVKLQFGEANADRSIQLSERCLALLAGSNLVGFVIRLRG